MSHAYICDGLRTPIGRYAGALSSVRSDDLAAIPIKALMERYPDADWTRLDDTYMGCANQAGEDNRNVARMATLLAGLPMDVPGATVNRLCGSGLEAVALASRAVNAKQGDFMLAGGVESMSRAPLVMPKPDAAFSRKAEIFDTTIGWRFVNPALKAVYGTDAMPETAENLAEEHSISREDQDAFALRSQQRAGKAMASGRMAKEIIAVSIPRRKTDDLIIDTDEHPRPESTAEDLAKLRAPFREGGSVTAGNASGTNDGAASLIVASEKEAAKNGLKPMTRIVGTAVAGVAPRTMGIGPVPATKKLLQRHGLSLSDIDLFEINEAFAAQALACTRSLGLPDDAENVNPNGGAIAFGHPLGMSGARLALTLTHELQQQKARYGIAAMCIGVGQGIAMLLERV